MRLFSPSLSPFNCLYNMDSAVRSRSESLPLPRGSAEAGSSLELRKTMLQSMAGDSLAGGGMAPTRATQRPSTMSIETLVDDSRSAGEFDSAPSTAVQLSFDEKPSWQGNASAAPLPSAKQAAMSPLSEFTPPATRRTHSLAFDSAAGGVKFTPMPASKGMRHARSHLSYAGTPGDDSDSALGATIATPQQFLNMTRTEPMGSAVSLGAGGGLNTSVALLSGMGTPRGSYVNMNMGSAAGLDSAELLRRLNAREAMLRQMSKQMEDFTVEKRKKNVETAELRAQLEAAEVETTAAKKKLAQVEAHLDSFAMTALKTAEELGEDPRQALNVYVLERQKQLQDQVAELQEALR